MEIIYTNDGLIDKQPQNITHCVCSASEIVRSVQVSIAGIATVQAFDKSTLSWSDCHNFVASSACFGSVGTGDGNGQDASLGSLVFNHSPEAGKRPVAQEGVEFLPHSSPSDAFEIFQNKNIPRICASDNLFADEVVDTARKTCPSALQFPEMPFGRLRSFGNELFLQPSHLVQFFLNQTAIKKQAVACGGYVVYAEVDSDGFRVQATTKFTDLFGNNDVKKQMLAMFDKRGTGYVPFGITFEILRDKDVELCPSVQSKKGTFSRHIEGVGTLVVLNRKRIGKGNLASGTSSFGLDGKLDGLAGKLRGKSGLLPDGAIHLLMQNLQRGNAMLPCIVVGKLRGFGKFMHRLKQGIRISNLQFHRSLNSHKSIRRKEYINVSAIPPTAKAMGFLADVKR